MSPDPIRQGRARISVGLFDQGIWRCGGSHKLYRSPVMSSGIEYSVDISPRLIRVCQWICLLWRTKGMT